MRKTTDYTPCGLPVRRRDGISPCALEAGHRGAWCKDERVLEQDRMLARVEELATEARTVLGVLGVAMGRGDTERWIRDWICREQAVRA